MKKNVTFEEALVFHEDEVRRLDSGNLSLDEALTSFEEAVKLVKLCNKKIDEAEQKVKMLIEAEDGSVSDAPFETDGNEA